MIKRELSRIISARLKSFPAVTIVGPRQAGKTTLAKTFSKTYFDLELEEERLKLDIQWKNITATKQLIVLDEAQNCPDIFPRIRSAIDADRRRVGRFLLLGSVSPGLMKTVSESLAGRVLISRTTDHVEGDGLISTNPRMFLKYLQKKLKKS